MISVRARKTSPDTISEASFSGIGKTWTGSFSTKRRGSTPASVAASGKRERRAKRSRERARVKGKKNRHREREAEGCGERSREDESKERRDELGLILPPQSGAASDSICFKYMDRGVWGPGRDGW
ncbi:unnamed protein product [Lasius platythorax]|uniref:Uncharacterized protein n=1 Tax=Lasius platythorax TaxID=488582 RepID=A0AAV2NRQ7_9HYME